MDKETLYILNDLFDAVSMMAEVVQELNPGASEKHRHIEFFLARIERQLDAAKVLEQS